MMCEACERGDHDNCGMQTWCECECEGFGGCNDAYYGVPDYDWQEDARESGGV